MDAARSPIVLATRKRVIGAGVIGAGVIGAGVIGAGVIGAGVIGAGVEVGTSVEGVVH